MSGINQITKGIKMKETHGIKNTKEIIKLGADFAAIVKQAKDNDGKINIMDIPLLLNVSDSFGPAIKDAKMVLSEIKDLDSSESKELIKYLGSELKETFTEKELVRKLEAIINWGIATADLVAAF